MAGGCAQFLVLFAVLRLATEHARAGQVQARPLRGIAQAQAAGRSTQARASARKDGRMWGRPVPDTTTRSTGSGGGGGGEGEAQPTELISRHPASETDRSELPPGF